MIIPVIMSSVPESAQPIMFPPVSLCGVTLSRSVTVLQARISHVAIPVATQSPAMSSKRSGRFIKTGSHIFWRGARTSQARTGGAAVPIDAALLRRVLPSGMRYRRAVFFCAVCDTVRRRGVCAGFLRAASDTVRYAIPQCAVRRTAFVPTSLRQSAR